MTLLTQKEISQMKWMMLNAIETRKGVICIYKDMLLIARTPEELHTMLDVFWEK